MSGSFDRTFRVNSHPKSFNQTSPATTSSPSEPQVDAPPPASQRPATVDPTANRQPDEDVDGADRTARPFTGGFGTLSSTGAFNGPYHVSPSRIRPTTKFTSGNDFFAATAQIEKPETMLSSTYLNNNTVKQHVQSKSEEDFVEGFLCFADINGASVSVFDVEEIVKNVLGDDIPRWIIEIFVVMCRNKSEYRRVKLTDFR